MPKGEHLKAGKRNNKPFSKEYQPSPEAKSAGHKRIKTILAAVEYFGNKVKSRVKVDGEEIELTYESNIFFKLMEKANNGDLKAIELISKVIPGFLQSQKVDNRNVDKDGNDVSNAPVIIMGMTPKKALEYINKEKEK